MSTSQEEEGEGGGGTSLRQGDERKVGRLDGLEKGLIRGGTDRHVRGAQYAGENQNREEWHLSKNTKSIGGNPVRLWGNQGEGRDKQKKSSSWRNPGGIETLDRNDLVRIRMRLIKSDAAELRRTKLEISARKHRKRKRKNHWKCDDRGVKPTQSVLVVTPCEHRPPERKDVVWYEGRGGHSRERGKKYYLSWSLGCGKAVGFLLYHKKKKRGGVKGGAVHAQWARA